MSKTGSIENVVTQNQTGCIITDKLLANDEGLRRSENSSVSGPQSRCLRRSKMEISTGSSTLRMGFRTGIITVLRMRVVT